MIEAACWTWLEDIGGGLALVRVGFDSGFKSTQLELLCLREIIWIVNYIPRHFGTRNNSTACLVEIRADFEQTDYYYYLTIDSKTIKNK